MRLFLLFILLAHLFLLSSCKKYKPATATFYLKSNVIALSPKGANGTTTDQKITDLWFYVNGQFEGIYPLGSLIPVPSGNKSVRINVFAGIKNNGIADTRIFYPFYDFLSFDTLIEGGKTIERNFTFNYRSVTVFTWTENFDVASAISIKKSPSGGGTIQILNDENSFEKNYLKLISPAGETLSRIESSSDGFVLPNGTGNVYLELNYKCNAAFVVGLMGTDGIVSPALVVNAQEKWNKIYIQLSNPVNTLITTKYKVYFELNGDANSPEKQVFLDNIKLIYLKN